MWWIDVLVVLMIALFAWIGWKKGLLSELFAMLNSVASLILALLLAKPFAMMMARVGKTQEAFTNIFASKFESIGQLGTELTSDTTVSVVLQDMADGMKGFFKLLTKWFVGGDTVIEAGQTPASVFGQAMGAVLLFVIAFIVLYIIFRIAAAFLTKYFRKLNKAPKIISVPNKVGGMGLGLFKAFLFVASILTIASFIPFLNDKVAGAVDGTFITKQLNWLTQKFLEFLGSHLNLSKMISGIFKAGQGGG